MAQTVTPDIAQQFLVDNFAPWVMALRPNVTEMDPKGATLVIPISDDIARTGGIVSGQALTALADTTMVIACGAAIGEMVPVGTVTLDTQFLRPCIGTSVEARADVTKVGRSMIFVRCEMIAQPSGKPVAMATATFAR